jgi:hypothetical protein
MVRLLVLALVLASTTAHAGKLTAGVSLGTSHDQKDDDAGLGGSQTVGLFGRLQLGARLAGQLELMKYDQANGSGTVVRTATALLVVDLSSNPRWVPTIMVGMGIDHASTPFDGSMESSGRHIEGGFGLEYRATGGFTIGADIRLGGRSVDDDEEPVIAIVMPYRLQASEYRAGRIWAGVRF